MIVIARPAAMILPEQSGQVRVGPLPLVRRGARQHGAPERQTVSVRPIGRTINPNPDQFKRGTCPASPILSLIHDYFRWIDSVFRGVLIQHRTTSFRCLWIYTPLHSRRSGLTFWSVYLSMLFGYVIEFPLDNLLPPT